MPRRFKLVFDTEIIVEADSEEKAYDKIQDGEIIRAGFKTNLKGVDYDHYQLPNFKLLEVT